MSEHRFSSMLEVRQRNKVRGHHFFDSDTMRFFNSRVSGNLYGGRYFVTSEQFDWKSPRLYTVRKALEEGTIETIGEFQQYTSWSGAHNKARRLGLNCPDGRDDCVLDS